MLVQDWMTRHVVSAPSNMTLGAALGLMNERKIRRLPVLRAGKLVGILTKSDVYAALGPLHYWDKADAQEQVVERYMTANPVTVAPREALEEAALIMHDRRVSGLPVEEKKKLVGMITETDIFRAFIEIMGLKEGGGRVTFRFGSGAGLLEKIQQRLGRMSLRSLVAYYDRKKADWLAVARVRGRD